MRAFSKIPVYFVAISIALLAWTGSAYAQRVSYEEVSVTLNVNYLGSTEIPALVIENDIYLPVLDVFQFVKVKTNPESDADTISGFFADLKNTYIIDGIEKQIIYQHKTIRLSEDDIIRTETSLYMKSALFNKIFGIQCRFDFRSLSVTLDSKTELPYIRELKLAQMRNNISKLNDEFISDTIIKAGFSKFHFGCADWNFTSNHILGQGSFFRFNMMTGGQVLGGEFNMMLNAGTGLWSEKQQFYQWKHVDNSNPLLRQLTMGKIVTRTLSSIYDPIMGIQLTNTPTYFRKSFGSYTLSNYTHPGWTVELYINNQLVDYVKADASGFFTFNVPLVYGNTAVTLKYYGPWGEQTTSQKSFVIPFTFIPSNQFEYNVTAGMVEDSLHSVITRGRALYGVSNKVTIGTGAEYYSSLKSQPLMPFVNSSVRFTSNLLLNAEYTYGIRTKANIIYRTPGNTQVEFNFVHYNPDQKAVRNNFVEERKLIISTPIKINSFTAFSRLTVARNLIKPDFSDFKYLPVGFVEPTGNTEVRNAELLLTSSYHFINVNSTTIGYSRPGDKPYFNTNMVVALFLPHHYILSPEVKYQYNSNKFISMKCTIEKRAFKHALINMAYEKNLLNNFNNFTFGVKYDLSFARTSVQVNRNQVSTSVIQSASGSVILEKKAKVFAANNLANVSKGGVIFTAFLDINGDGVRDENEPKVNGLSVRSSSGGSTASRSDSTIVITGLEPYINFNVEFSCNNFENIAWRINKPRVAVAIEPNKVRCIDIPVEIVGEVSGTVYRKVSNSKKAQGAIRILIYNSKGEVVASALSEADGFFNYLGLSPGNYTASVDEKQLKKVGFVATPPVSFTIAAKIDGDVAEDISFTISDKH